MRTLKRMRILNSTAVALCRQALRTHAGAPGYDGRWKPTEDEREKCVAFVNDQRGQHQEKDDAIGVAVACLALPTVMQIPSLLVPPPTT